MTLLEKLLEIQKSIDKFTKDNTVGEGRSAYKAVSSDQVLDAVRPLMNELKLILEPSICDTKVTTGSTASGTTRYFTELFMTMTWIDIESGEERAVKWYGQGVDLAGEKGVGKANTYAEKYFFMKYFHVPTPNDDPDNSSRTKAGELKTRGTQAEKETEQQHRNAISQMLNTLCSGVEADIKQAILVLTRNKERNYAGVDNVEAISLAALPIVYNKAKKHYKDRTGKDFVYKPEE